MQAALKRPFVSLSVKDPAGSALVSSLVDLTNQLNAQVSVGAILASAPTITLTSRIHHVSGTAAIKTIKTPSQFAGGDVFLIPDGAWTAATGGNIGAAFTATAHVPVLAVFDGSLWWLK